MRFANLGHDDYQLVLVGVSFVSRITPAIYSATPPLPSLAISSKHQTTLPSCGTSRSRLDAATTFLLASLLFRFTLERLITRNFGRVEISQMPLSLRRPSESGRGGAAHRGQLAPPPHHLISIKPSFPVLVCFSRRIK
jgi:hypothetical protein